MQMNPDDMIASLSNFPEALETFAGDREILAEVLGVFSSEYPRQLAELRGAIDRKEPAAVRRCVHKIKSSGRHLRISPSLGHRREARDRRAKWRSVEGSSGSEKIERCHESDVPFLGGHPDQTTAP